MKTLPNPDPDRDGTDMLRHPSQPEARDLAARLAKSEPALHALDALEKAAERPEEEAPPIPADLRDRWNDRFGAKAAPAPRRAPAEEKVSFFAWLGALLFPQSPGWRLAATFAAVLIVAGGALILNESPKPDEGVVLRGGEPIGEVAKLPPLIVVATTDQHGEFRRRWSGAPPYEAATRADAETRAASLPAAFVADVAAGEVALWRSAKRVESRKIEEAVPGRPVSNAVRALESWSAELQRE